MVRDKHKLGSIGLVYFLPPMFLSVQTESLTSLEKVDNVTIGQLFLKKN